MTELGVRPCVAWLRATASARQNGNPLDPARDLLPKLDAKEVAAVFTAPFHNFLRQTDEDERDRKVEGQWYKGSWISWHESNWRMHQFHVPVTPSSVFLAKKSPPASPSSSNPDLDSDSDETTDPSDSGSASTDAARHTAEALKQPRYRVFGMTARILVDCARVAYAEDPEFEHNSMFGDEVMIERLRKIGRLGETKKEGERLTRDVMEKAKNAKLS